MKSVDIRPLSSKKESVFLFLFVIITLLVAYTLIILTRKEEQTQKISEYQISAYKELSNINNSFYSDILNSLIEIKMLSEESNEVPNIKVLEEEEISPFVRDTIWENRGSVAWKKGKLKGQTYYIGLSQNLDRVGNFLIIFSKDIEKSKIYYSQEKITDENTMYTLTHIQKYWKEVLPYTGKDERKKY